MGLKNICAETLDLKYNGVEVSLIPDAVIDVRDFNINNAEVPAVEDLLLEKYIHPESRKKLLERSKTLSNMTDKQINAEIDRLNEVIAELRAEAKPREDEIVKSTADLNDMSWKLSQAKTTIDQYEEILTELDPKWKKKLAKPDKDAK